MRLRRAGTCWGCRVSRDVHPKEGDAAPAARQQRSIEIDAPWSHITATRITAWGEYHGEVQAIVGRCGLTLRSGSATFDIDPTPDQMRAIAALLVEAADAAGAA